MSKISFVRECTLIEDGKEKIVERRFKVFNETLAEEIGIFNTGEKEIYNIVGDEQTIQKIKNASTNIQAKHQVLETETSLVVPVSNNLTFCEKFNILESWSLKHVIYFKELQNCKDLDYLPGASILDGNFFEELVSEHKPVYYFRANTPTLKTRQQIATIYFKERERETGFFEVDQLIAFSSLPYTKERNRLCQKFGSENFLTVQFILPPFDSTNIAQSNGFKENDYKITDQLMTRDSKDIYKSSRILENFEKPLQIAGEEFEFLCCNSTGAVTQKFLFVNSKIRRQVLKWAFKNNSEFNRQKVLKGDKPMLVPLRLSLINSLCVPTLEIKEEDFSEEMDDGEKDYRDGCGFITDKGLLERIIKQYFDNYFSVDVDPNEPQRNEDLPSKLPEGYLPSAIQIRYRGYKGMLAFFPNKRKSNGKRIYFTKSMKKFEPEVDDIMNKLQIVGMSKPYTYTILSSELIYMFMGLAKNEEELCKYLKEIVIDKREDLGGKSIDELFADENLKTKILESRGECLNADLFIGSKVFSDYLLTLNVPIPKSAHLYGITDFSENLDIDEIFIQVYDEQTGKCKVIEGDVLVAKTPSLFSSDLRKFKAVKKPALMDFKDVLIFSSKGPTFVPSLISGADLDGDHFYIMWDPKLVENIECEPVNNKAELPVPVPVPWSFRQSFTKWVLVACKHLLSKFSNLAILIGLSKPEETVPLYEASLADSYKILLQAIDSLKYCSFSHLLELRRIYVDHYGSDWVTNEEHKSKMKIIGDAITSTIDAPKHGKWKEWTEYLQILQNIPKNPHYLFGSNAKASSSIFGKLFNQLTDKICYVLFKQVDNRDQFISSKKAFQCLLYCLKEDIHKCKVSPHAYWKNFQNSIPYFNGETKKLMENCKDHSSVYSVCCFIDLENKQRSILNRADLPPMTKLIFLIHIARLLKEFTVPLSEEEIVTFINKEENSIMKLEIDIAKISISDYTKWPEYKHGF